MNKTYLYFIYAALIILMGGYFLYEISSEEYKTANEQIKAELNINM